MIGGFQVGAFQPAYQQVITQSETTSGGWGYYNDFILSRNRRIARQRRERERKDDEREIQQELDRQLARALYEQEQRDEERADLERIQKLADSLMSQKTDLPRPVLASVMKAHEERTRNALQQLERVVAQLLEEEEAIVVAVLLLDD